jgi:hypothetical protein
MRELMNEVLQWVRKNKKLSILITIGLGIVILIVLLFSYSCENRRLRKNQSQLSTPVGVEIRTTADGKSIAETQALNMKVSELEASRDSLLKTVKILGVKNSRLLALAQAATQSEAKIKASMKDSIVYLPGKTDTLPGRVDTLRCMQWKDPWLTVDGCIRDGAFDGSVTNLDTLDIVAHRVPKRFLFFRFGCKAVRLDVVSHNPHTRLTGARYIRLER